MHRVLVLVLLRDSPLRRFILSCILKLVSFFFGLVDGAFVVLPGGVDGQNEQRRGTSVDDL